MLVLPKLESPSPSSSTDKTRIALARPWPPSFWISHYPTIQYHLDMAHQGHPSNVMSDSLENTAWMDDGSGNVLYPVQASSSSSLTGQRPPLDRRSNSESYDGFTDQDDEYHDKYRNESGIPMKSTAQMPSLYPSYPSYDSLSSDNRSGQDYRSRTGSGQSSGRASGSGGFKSSGRRESAAGSSSQRGRGDTSGYEPPGGNRNRKQKEKAMAVDEDSTGPKLACPYFQRQPTHERLERSCTGPGFPTIPRLKEHLYRRHMCFICGRCRMQFYKHSDLEAHMQNDDACPKNAVTIDPQKGFGKEEEKALRAKKRHMQWEDVYRILFPGEDVPSPYYSNDINDRILNYKFQLQRTIKSELPLILQRDFQHFGPEIVAQLTTRLPSSVCSLIDSMNDPRPSITSSSYAPDQDPLDPYIPTQTPTPGLQTAYQPQPQTHHQPPASLHHSLSQNAAISPGTRMPDHHTSHVHHPQHASASTAYPAPGQLWGGRHVAAAQAQGTYPMPSMYPLQGSAQEASQIDYEMTSVAPQFTTDPWHMPPPGPTR